MSSRMQPIRGTIRTSRPCLLNQSFAWALRLAVVLACAGCDVAGSDDEELASWSPASLSSRGSPPRLVMATDPLPQLATAFCDEPSTEFAGSAALLDQRARVGVPEGWESNIADQEYLVVHATEGNGARIVLTSVQANDPFEEQDLTAWLKELASPARLTQLSWGSFVEGFTGRDRYPARVAGGVGESEGRPRQAFAVVIKLPRRQAVALMGSWPRGNALARAQAIDVVRSLAPCEASGRDCRG